MTKTISYALALGYLLIACIDANPITKRAADVATEFIILHNNDMHARFEQTSVDSTKCTPDLANTDKCYGGFARVAFEVRKFRDEAQKGGQAVLYLNAGDTYTGTPWFTVYKDNITSAFMNKLMPDAISLGNHEFDEGVEGLVPFLKDVKFPVLAANLDLSQTPELQNEPNLRPSAILDVRGTKVGVVGYLTPETKNLTRPSSVIFQEEIKAINAEAAKLKSQGVHIIIALGHSGYQEDQNIAKGCPDVDIVIGGHTNTFLYNGEQPDAERIDGPYPTVIKQSSGKSVPVVQAYAYTKYLGRLHVQFDKDGNLLEFDGTPILLNASVHREDDVLELLEVYRPKIEELENDIVGHTKVHLEGRAEVCRVEECNLGNLITDAMIYARAIEDMGGAYWTDAPIAFLGGGGIRNSIMKASDGAITGNDILGVLPFGNDLVVTKISGKTVRGALEHSAYLRSQDSNGGFLQMSGVYVTYDFNKPEGQRVVSVEVRCAECDVPSYSPLDDTKMYNVIVPTFFYNGGDGHVFKEPGTPEDFVPTRLQKNDNEALRQYLKQRDFVYPELEERIKIIEAPKGDSAAGLASSIFAITCALILRSIL